MNTENQIRRAAYAVFVKYGFHATTLEMIARKANVNKASIHYYFRSKESLYRIVVDQIKEKKIKRELNPTEIWFLITENHNNERLFQNAFGKSMDRKQFKHILNNIKPSMNILFNSK